MRYLLHTILFENVGQSIDARRETTVQAEDLLLDQSGKWQIVKQIRERLPNIRIAVLSQALIVETVDLESSPTSVVNDAQTTQAQARKYTSQSQLINRFQAAGGLKHKMLC